MHLTSLNSFTKKNNGDFVHHLRLILIHGLFFYMLISGLLRFSFCSVSSISFAIIHLKILKLSFFPFRIYVDLFLTSPLSS